MDLPDMFFFRLHGNFYLVSCVDSSERKQASYLLLGKENGKVRKWLGPFHSSKQSSHLLCGLS